MDPEMWRRAASRRKKRQRERGDREMERGNKTLSKMERIDGNLPVQAKKGGIKPNADKMGKRGRLMQNAEVNV